jgi:predicted HTH transcriptional regulator
MKTLAPGLALSLPSLEAIRKAPFPQASRQGGFPLDTRHPPQYIYRSTMNETHFQILRLLQSNPRMNQRDMASELGISLGKANYCLRALVKKGWVKAKSFQKSK